VISDWIACHTDTDFAVMDKGYNQKLECFIQSYESNEVLDSAVLIAPLVFFISPTDPRFLKTLDKILLAPDKGGLTSTGLVYRYNHALSDDGVGGRGKTNQVKMRVRLLLTLVPTIYRGGFLHVHFLACRSSDESTLSLVVHDLKSR
jgi:GH15 family glucan-1,4-alpha-glucosidase